MSLFTEFSAGPLRPLTKKPLTKGQIEYRFRVWQYRLGLQNFYIAIDWDSHPDDTGIAEVNAQDNSYDRCALRFHKKVTKWPGNAWGRARFFLCDEVLVHELVHIHMARTDRIVFLAGEFLKKQTETLWMYAYGDAREAFIDRLAVAFVAAYEEVDNG